MPSPEAAPGLSADSFGPMATNSTLDSPCRRRAVAFPRVPVQGHRSIAVGRMMLPDVAWIAIWQAMYDPRLWIGAGSSPANAREDERFARRWRLGCGLFSLP
jgi:hypothetical protein